MKKRLLIVIGLLLVIAIGVGVSYAYYIASISQVGENVIRTDCFKLDFIDNGQIVLDNTYPIKNSDANDVSPYHFKIKNVCNLPASYQVNLEVLDDSTLDIGYLNYKLDDGSITGLDNVAVKSSVPTLSNASTAKIIATGNLIANEEKEYDLRVFVKESVTTADPVENKVFKSKVVVISTLNKSIMKSIKLNANGGTLPYDTFQGYVGYKFNNLPTPEKENDNFLGWYTDSEFNNKVTNETIVTNEMTDLYAKYGTLSYSVVSGDLDTVGSVVKIADEEFYVIGQEDSTHVKLLSKWNLKVGDILDSQSNNAHAKIGEYTNADVGYGLQSSDAKGRVAGNPTWNGVLDFSSTNYWHDSTNNKTKDEYGGYTYNTSTYFYNDGQGNVVFPYVYDSNSNIKQYVDNYVTYLNTQGVNVSGRLIKREELVNLGCNRVENSEGLICASYIEGYEDYNGIGTAPEWVYQTSYWSGSAIDIYILTVESDGYTGVGVYKSGETYIEETGEYVRSDKMRGVRPVIILEK